MRLHRITLRDVKAVTERTVELPDSGIIVLEGPNEIGKSTLLEAFDHLLDKPHSSKHREVWAMKPVNRDVGPYVEAEFTIGEHRVRFAKRWLRRPKAELHILSPQPEQLTGKQAHDRVQALLKKSLDQTLWDALRFSQSGDGSMSPLVASDALRKALDAAAGARLHAGDGERVLDAVEKEFRLYYTPTGHKTGEYRAAIEHYQQAQQGLEDAERKVVEAEGLLTDLEEARGQVVELTALHQQSLQDHEDRDRAWTQAQELLEALAQEERALSQAQLAAREARTGLLRRRTETNQLQEMQTQIELLRAQVQEQRATSAARSAQAQSARVRAAQAEELQESRERTRDYWEAMVDLARHDRDQVHYGEQQAQLRAAIDRVAQLTTELARLAAEAPQPQISDSQLSALRARHLAWSVKDEHHRSEGTTVLVESLGRGVQIDGAELSAHESRTLPLSEALVVDVPGAVRVTIRPEAATHQRAAEVALLLSHYESALAELGVTDMDHAQGQRDRCLEYDAQMRVLEDDLRGTLGLCGVDVESCMAQSREGRFPEALGERQRSLEQRGLEAESDRAELQAVLDALTAPSEVKKKEEQLDPHERLSAATDSLRTAQAAVELARVECRRAREEARGFDQAAAEASSQLSHAEASLAAQENQWKQRSDALQEARDEVADEDLAQRAQDQDDAVDAARNQVEQAQQRIHQEGLEELKAECERARAQLIAHEQALQGARRTKHELTGKVELVAAEGRAEQQNLAEAQLRAATSEVAALDRRARAVRHLRTVLHRHRDAARATYVAPFTHALEELGQQVYGTGFTVTVDEHLTLTERTLDGATIAFEQLSGGAKEQLGILSRLAVARLVDPRQGVPVVIDDALGYSDPKRLADMAQVLGASVEGADLQLILITCTPDRYAAIPGAHQIRLTAA